MTTTLTETTRNLQGCKVQTTLDTQKKEVRFLLTSISGKFYNVFDRVEKKNIEIVGKRSFNAWSKLNNYMTDF